MKTSCQLSLPCFSHGALDVLLARLVPESRYERCRTRVGSKSKVVGKSSWLVMPVVVCCSDLLLLLCCELLCWGACICDFHQCNVAYTGRSRGTGALLTFSNLTNCRQFWIPNRCCASISHLSSSLLHPFLPVGTQGSPIPWTGFADLEFGDLAMVWAIDSSKRRTLIA